MTIDFKIIGIQKLTRKAGKIRNKLDNRILINRQAVVLADRWIQKNFQQEGKLAYDGSRWEPLSDITIARRRKGPKKGRAARILQDTGQLKSRWKHYWTRRIGLIQSGVPYAIFHHEGTGRIPQRRILPEKKQIMPDLLKLFGRWIKTNLR